MLRASPEINGNTNYRENYKTLMHFSLSYPRTKEEHSWEQIKSVASEKIQYMLYTNNKY